MKIMKVEFYRAASLMSSVTAELFLLRHDKNVSFENKSNMLENHLN